MNDVIAALSTVETFVDSGGPILMVIAAVTCVMWTLIFERLWFYKATLRNTVNGTVKRWDARAERKSWNAHQIRIAMISRVTEQIRLNLDVIGTLVALCPLFGLLGTVVGMIEVFNVLATSGGADAKSMAGGVKQATIPTMAGMVAAISGVFGSTIVNQIANRESQLLEDHMTMDH
ncbi:MotA/TolQ/ExbB proton channel family protein [Marinagarivorans cellulosilyticus]|uniref:Biopolymer transport protein ExbB n=1 Tax=Marinagarivorans cellulosilyticus TaxID=2721545 RepID=A0AAN1WLC0_9GAMM|nr:MotA/TolQ/ExbB proton channel family protein [Marinagarivorans cellulosilyticus]BCD99716.1 biopolymer transport protein ExbB [Marinagarivorans cellulosilyticus]